MKYNSKDFTADKIKLIYEFNPQSPLFARVASYIIEEGSIAEAINILEKGLKLYPNYPSAYFVLALANAYSGNEDEAKKNVHLGNSFINSEETKNFYIKKIDEIILERNSLKEIKRPAFLDEETKNKEPEDSIENRLDILAEQLSKARITYVPDSNQQTELEIPEYSGKKIISETLAKIYESQKNYKEAIAIYKELIKINPNKSDYYNAKISEISQIIDTGLV